MTTTTSSTTTLNNKHKLLYKEQSEYAKKIKLIMDTKEGVDQDKELKEAIADIENSYLKKIKELEEAYLACIPRVRDYYDVVLYFKEQDYVHCCVKLDLIRVSPVFKTMFESKFQEGDVFLGDLEKQVVELVIPFKVERVSLIHLLDVIRPGSITTLPTVVTYNNSTLIYELLQLCDLYDIHSIKYRLMPIFKSQEYQMDMECLIRFLYLFWDTHNEEGFSYCLFQLATDIMCYSNSKTTLIKLIQSKRWRNGKLNSLLLKTILHIASTPKLDQYNQPIQFQPKYAKQVFQSIETHAMRKIISRKMGVSDPTVKESTAQRQLFTTPEKTNKVNNP